MSESFRCHPHPPTLARATVTRVVVAFALLFALSLGARSATRPAQAAAACTFTNAALANGSSFTAGQYVGVQANALCPGTAGGTITFVLAGAAWQTHVVSLAGSSSSFAGTQFVFSTAGFAPGNYSMLVTANGTTDRQGPLTFTVQ